MNCWLLNKKNYIECAKDVYNLTDNKQAAIKVASLYKLNEETFNIRYDETINSKKIQEKEFLIDEETQRTPEAFYRILNFFNCVRYQCDEIDEIYKQVCEITESVSYLLARDIFDNMLDDCTWGEY